MAGREKALQVRFRELARQEQGNKCYYCQVEMSDSCSGLRTACTAEHLTPRSWGGKACRRNIKAACWACNQKRADGAPLHVPSGVKHERNVRKTDADVERAVRKQDEAFARWRQSCLVK